jgi:hypothetical protein
MMADQNKRGFILMGDLGDELDSGVNRLNQSGRKQIVSVIQSRIWEVIVPIENNTGVRDVMIRIIGLNHP